MPYAPGSSARGAGRLGSATAVRGGVNITWNAEYIIKDVARRSREAVNMALALAVKIARMLVRKRTRLLMGSIEMQPARTRYNVIEGRFGVFNDPGYAIYQEYGTARMPAKPFLRPASDIAFRDLPAYIAGGVMGVPRIGGTADYANVRVF